MPVVRTDALAVGKTVTWLQVTINISRMQSTAIFNSVWKSTLIIMFVQVIVLMEWRVCSNYFSYYIISQVTQIFSWFLIISWDLEVLFFADTDLFSLQLSEAYVLLWQNSSTGDVNGRQGSKNKIGGSVSAVLLDLIAMGKIKIEFEEKKFLFVKYTDIWVKVSSIEYILLSFFCLSVSWNAISVACTQFAFLDP